MKFLDFFKRKREKVPTPFIPDVILFERKSYGPVVLPEENELNIFRLRYIYCSIFGGMDMKNYNEMHDISLKKFVAPEGMTHEEIFKVVSYIAEKAEREQKLEECSWTSVQETDNMLESYYFKHLNNDDKSPCSDIQTINGDFELFKRSKRYKNYFEWFTKNVSEEEIHNIYTRLGLDYSKLGVIEQPTDEDQCME